MIDKLRRQINRYIVGKEDVVDMVLVCILAGGHILLEDVPGVGKTTLAKTVAGACDLDFSRIQFTPDTLPSDVTGLSIYNMKTGEFEYHEGAVIHQIVLADEINRTSPKTQACLLEAMAEKQVTVEGVIRKLPEPFIVIATQNPVDYIGTYALPEAQLDRFMMKLSVGYPSNEQEIIMAKKHLSGDMNTDVAAVCHAEDILTYRDKVEKVEINDRVLNYIENIIDMTRKDARFVLGASPRAMLHLIRASQAKAFISGQNYVTPDDVKNVAVCVLHHRLSLSSEAKISGKNIDDIIYSIVIGAPVPTV